MDSKRVRGVVEPLTVFLNPRRKLCSTNDSIREKRSLYCWARSALSLNDSFILFIYLNINGETSSLYPSSPSEYAKNLVTSSSGSRSFFCFAETGASLINNSLAANSLIKSINGPRKTPRLTSAGLATLLPVFILSNKSILASISVSSDSMIPRIDLFKIFLWRANGKSSNFVPLRRSSRSSPSRVKRFLKYSSRVLSLCEPSTISSFPVSSFIQKNTNGIGRPMISDSINLHFLGSSQVYSR